MNTERIYSKSYKKLMFIPLILLVLAIAVLLINNARTGSIVDRDISLVGGIDITINKEGLNFNELKSYLEENFENVEVRELTDLTTRKGIGVNIKVADVSEEEIKAVLSKKIDINFNDVEEYTASTTSARFSASVYSSLIKVIIFAFILMGVVVFVAFRNFIPSIAVISAAFMDIVITLAILDLIGMKLSSAGIIAFLLVIGYSIDTDVLLTTRILKRREGGLYERLGGAIKTGLTMTCTTIAALTAAAVVSSYINPILTQMFIIILIALVIDVITTYFFNASILVWYYKKRGLT